MNRYVRTIKDCQDVIIHAKHKLDEVFPISQAFYYPNRTKCEIASSEIRLMDIDEKLLQTIEEGESLVFRGDDDDKLVLCTNSETFEVKEGEISNALVLTHDLLYFNEIQSFKNSETSVVEKEVVGVFDKYLELRPTYPRLHKLKTLLENCRYKGPEHEDSNSIYGYYTYELLNLVQSSKEELLRGLDDIMACCINERWRLLDLEYETRVLSFIANLMEEKSWDQIPRDDCLKILKNLVPVPILEHVLNNFTHENENGDLIWKPERVCRSFAEMLLRAGEGKFRYNEFMMAWKQCLPSGVAPDLNYLRGLALIEQSGTQQQVMHLFPESNLPENVPERFRLLFKRKEKWTLEEIQPYIEKLCNKNMNVNMMLTKSSRQSTINGVRVFGARHAK